MKRLKIKIIERLIPNKKLWDVCGNIAERFYDKEDGAYDDLQEKLYFWFRAVYF